jgi:MFS family permease
MESPHPEKQKLWTKNFLLFTLSNLFLYLNLQMITPSIPSYITGKFGSSSVMVSLVISAFAIAAIFTRLFVGKGLETKNRKQILLWGVFIFAVSTCGYYVVGSVALFIVIRLISGVGFGMASTSFGTMVSDIVPPKRMGEGIGYFGLSTSLSMSLAPVIGLWLLNQFEPFVLFTVATVLVVLIFPLSLFFKSSKTVQLIKPTPTAMHAAKKTKFMDKKLILPCGLNLLLSITYGGLISFIALFGKEIHIANVGWFFLCNALMVLLVRPFSGKLFDKRGHAAVLPFGACMVFIALLLLSYSTSMISVIGSALFYGLGYGALQPSLQAWAINSVTHDQRGMANGVFLNSIDLGIAMGSLCLGVVATATNYAMVYRVSSLFMALFLIIYAANFLVRRKKVYG